LRLSPQRRPGLRCKRALVTWVIAYVSIEFLGIGVFFLIAAIQHTGSYTHPTQDPSYALEQKYLPLANLAIWTMLALAYFGRRRSTGRSWLTEPLWLGALWLAIALPADFLFFVVIKNPSSLTAHDFYIGQFPWIYLTYVAVFISPMCAVAIKLWRRRPEALR
jgi:hypothetical protein